MSYDAKIFVACNHSVNGTMYDLNSCPRCYGKGYYFDIFFGDNGQPILTSGAAKLQQEILKILMESKGDNIFYPQWGSDINDRLVGSKNVNVNTSKIQLLVQNVLNYLQNVQQGENYVWDNMTPDEMLGTINSISVVQNGPTSYVVQVKITNQMGITSTQVFSV